MQLKAQLDMQYTKTVKRLIQRLITSIPTLNLNMIQNTLTLYPRLTITLMKVINLQISFPQHIPRLPK